MIKYNKNGGLFHPLNKLKYTSIIVMTKNKLEKNPTEIQKVYYLQNEFDQLNKSTIFNKLIHAFNHNPTEKNFNNIITMLNKFIDFEILNNNNKITFYLIDENGKMIISNIDNVYSTFVNYIDNTTYFYNLSEEQGFLNEQFELENDGKIGTNLLETPILNVVINIIDNPLGVLYFLIGQKNKCQKYKLISFIYTNG